MKILTRSNFKYGTIDTLEDTSIPPGAASRSLGWLTKGDHIELVRGRFRLGTEISGLGRVSGIHVGYKTDGTEVLFRSRGKIVEYYDTATEDWVEMTVTGGSSSNILGNGVVTADEPYGEDVTFDSYTNLAGAQVWFSSPNSSLFKLMVANPGTCKDMYVAANNFKGWITIKKNAMFLWNRGGATKDQQGLYRSKLDKDEVADYTLVSNEALGSSGSSTYSGTLSAISGKRTAFGVSIDDTSETFTDNKDGTLTGSAGGTGTINYTTGAYSVTFAIPAVGAVTADYYWEDASDGSTGSGAGAIGDFRKSGTRAAGEGFFMPQFKGGRFQWPALFDGVFYCLHEFVTYALGISADDLTATNDIFRESAGIPYFRARVETGKGIYYIDNTNQSEPRVRLLTFDSAVSKVVPVPISNNIKLSDYRFDRAAGVEWGDYILFACRTSTSTVNNRILAFNKLWESWDVLPYYASCFAIYGGVLLIGDSLSSNVYEIFSGFDDDGTEIENYWEGVADNLGIKGLNKVKKITLEGTIGPDQAIRVYAANDNGTYVEIGVGAATSQWPDGEPAIYGGGSGGSTTYVDRSQRVNVGSQTLGRGEVGGGGSGVEAYHYERCFTFGQGRFEYSKLKFMAVGIGFASVSRQDWHDIRHKSNKVPLRYRG